MAYDWILIVAAIAAVVGAGKLLKFKIPIPKNAAWVLLIGGVLVGAWQLGFLSQLAETPITPQPIVPAAGITTGVSFDAEGSETDSNVTMTNQYTFVCSYVENDSADNVGGAVSPYTTITSVTGTITVYRTDMLSLSDNAVSKIWADVPAFYGTAGTDNESLLYRPVTFDTTTSKYNITFTPSGGSARDEESYFTVANGGSRAISFTATISTSGLIQLDNFDSVEIPIHVYGLDQAFTLRFTKTGEVT